MRHRALCGCVAHFCTSFVVMYPSGFIRSWSVEGIPAPSASRHSIMTAAMFGQMISCQESLLPVTESWEEVMQPHYSVPRLLPCKISRSDLCHGGSRPNNTDLTSFPSATPLVWQRSRLVPRQEGIVSTQLIPIWLLLYSQGCTHFDSERLDPGHVFHMSGKGLPERSNKLQTALFSLEEEPHGFRAKLADRNVLFFFYFSFFLFPPPTKKCGSAARRPAQAAHSSDRSVCASQISGEG